MIDKFIDTPEAAVADVHDGAIVLISGFGGAGMPTELIHALIDQGARELTVVSNNAGNRETGLAALVKAGRVRKVICSFPKASHSWVFDELYRQGRIELECVPQGTIAERLRAAGAGLGGFFTPTAYGTELARGKETRIINGRGHVFEEPLHGDFALVKADRGDRWGNLTYNMSARNFGPIMCMAAKTTIVQVRAKAELGELPPEAVVTPGIFVKRVTEVPNAAFSS
ncbi:MULTISPECIES: 3-oxoacid CoA-transferase subunit A [Achromobacter]|uniref:3-oxoacid CoA-transferase subunit A n=1 Tax=Achromobacter TaxID=222 RepID=UPI001467F0C9|nr:MULTISPECIES: 3-oxoacid CoA-transferase subunit A [Achromobacter]MCG7328470.1 3-oxoacid CoA-transferase subunit A [Achromobacter sp. ACRQX]MDH0682583.1 3-oxoacid CoA-transferase subunit A [Achromobacter animicus]CAB3905918.1 3-oxoadipate CoA-transferase subunit A [Achromobacter animicus]